MRRGNIHRDDRGVSEVLGTTLLVGLVFAGAIVTLFVGGQALDQASGQQQAAAAEASLEQADRTFTSLAGGSGPNRTMIDLSGDAGGEINLVRAGEITLSVNQDASCTTTIPLSSLRFEQSGQTTAFEAGGVWKAARSNGSAMVSPPNVGFRNGTLDMTVLNLTGTADQDSNVAEYREEESLSRSEEVEVELLSAPCQNPNNITVAVQSDFYHAWGEYFRSNFAIGTVDVVHSNDTARLLIPDDDFPARLDNERNRVINLSHASTASYMNDVTIGGDSITANKTKFDGSSVGPFPATLTPLDRSEPPEIGTVQSLAPGNATEVFRSPVDVVFVMDESGSMTGSKISDAKDAAKSAVDVLNTSVVGDRVGLVGYRANTRYLYPNNQYLSADSSKVKSKIGGFNANPSGKTNIASGFNGSIALLDTVRDERNRGNILLLTDGKNKPGNDKCQEYDFTNETTACINHFNNRTLNAAHIADKRGYTVFTFGFANNPSEVNETLLKEVANITGGEYFFSADGDELEQNFANATQQIKNAQQYLTRTPISTNLSTGSGQVIAPEIPGDVDGIASSNSSGETFLNVNDPAAPALFRHSFAVDNGETVQFNATVYECSEWQSTGSLAEHNNSTYPVARCGNITTTNSSLDATHVSIHTNWHKSDATSLQKNDDVNETLEPFVDANGTFTLGSNQAVVRLDFEPHGGVENDMFLFYRVGLAESGVETSDLIDVEVNQIEVGS